MSYTVDDVKRKLAHLQQCKEDIKRALIDKCTSVTDDTLFSEYPSKVGEIQPRQSLMIPKSYLGSDFRLKGHIKITSGVTNLARGLFEQPLALTSVTIPSSVTSVASFTFNGCRNLAAVILEGSVPLDLQTNAFVNDGASTVVFYVPDASVDAYKAATNWVAYADRIYPISQLST